MLQNFVTMYGAKNVLLTEGPSPPQKRREFPVIQEINDKILSCMNIRNQEAMSDP